MKHKLKAKNKHVGFESYEVKFWMQKPDGYWEQRIKTYFGYSSKSAHGKVKSDCIKEFGKEIRIVSVSYQ